MALLHCYLLLTKRYKQMLWTLPNSSPLQETLSDGLLRQGRESLHYLQNEQRAQADELTEIKTIAEEQQGAKQLSLDVHVSRTKAEQKLDALQKDVTGFIAWTQLAIRGLNVLGPVLDYPLSRVTTSDLLRALLARGSF